MGQCSQIVYDATGFHRHQCNRTATVIRVKDGRDFAFCRQHDPVEVVRREREKREKRDQARAATDATEVRLRKLVKLVGAGRPFWHDGHWADGVFFSTAEVKDLILRLGENPEAEPYDKAFGDDRKCACGHAYYRHFDTYEAMRPVGCKYFNECHCEGFRAIDSQ